MDVAPDQDAARHGEQREQQQDEGDVVEERRVGERVKAVAGPRISGHRARDQERPQGRDLALVMLPGMRREQGKKRDREQDADEGERPGQAERAPVELCRERRFWKHDRRAASAGRNARSVTDGVPLRAGRGRSIVLDRALKHEPKSCSLVPDKTLPEKF